LRIRCGVGLTSFEHKIQTTMAIIAALWFEPGTARGSVQRRSGSQTSAKFDTHAYVHGVECPRMGEKALSFEHRSWIAVSIWATDLSEKRLVVVAPQNIEGDVYAGIKPHLEEELVVVCCHISRNE
jgi:hypothetical protein